MRYQRIIFLQNDEAAEPLRIREEQGTEAAIEYLAQWDFGDSSEEFAEPASGDSDDVVESENGRYRLTWNDRLGYIGLEGVIADSEQP